MHCLQRKQRGIWKTGQGAEGTIYVSIKYATAVHKCACGCGQEVVTPISPTDWRLTFDGESISLCPSIGNWSFACRSHYLIKNNRVSWAPRMSKKAIAMGRAHDRRLKEQQFSTTRTIDKAKAAYQEQGKRRLFDLDRWVPAKIRNAIKKYLLR
jgi:hypothetical protein